MFVGTNSLKQYYKDMSFDKFTFEPAKETSAYGIDGNTNEYDRADDGIIHVTIDRAKEQSWAVDDDNVDAEDEDQALCLAAALDKAADYIDFASYDSNGDGTIQTSELAICFVPAGKDYTSIPSSLEPTLVTDENKYMYTRSYAYTFGKLIGTISEIPHPGGIAVNNFIVTPEERYVSSSVGFGQEGIGTLAHELGHYLGLPDLYHTSSLTIGSWTSYDCTYLSLMNCGCYGVDLNNNERPYSLDIYCRAKLGWIEPKVWSASDLEDPGTDDCEIAGSLDATDGAVNALKICTSRPREYYIVENRRFTSWDEGMSITYSSAASDNGKDLGGGLIFWHIDEDIYDGCFDSNSVNNFNHHPAIMPAFREEADGKITFIGTSVTRTNPFFTYENWDEAENGTIKLPLYKETGSRTDKPSDRLQSADLLLGIEDNGGSSRIVLHRHEPLYPEALWNDDYTEAALYMLCANCYNDITDIETTTDITSEVVSKPTTTEYGRAVYTAHFTTEGIGSLSDEIETDPLSEDEVNKRTEALAQLRDKIIAANSALATGSYTEESAQALRGAIAEANAVFDDDSAVAEDAKTAEIKLLEAWRLLEPVSNSGSGSGESGESGSSANQAWRNAVNELAETLVSIYRNVDPGEYKPADYAAFTAATDEAFALLEKEDSTTDELEAMKTAIVKAWTSLEKNGRRVSSAKAANTLAVKGRTASLKYSKLNKKAQKLTAAKMIKFTSKGQGALTYKLASAKKGSKSFKKYFKLNKETGKIIIKKGLKKGTCQLKIKIKAAGDSNHAASAYKTATVKIIIK